MKTCKVCKFCIYLYYAGKKLPFLRLFQLKSTIFETSQSYISVFYNISPPSSGVARKRTKRTGGTSPPSILILIVFKIFLNLK